MSSKMNRAKLWLSVVIIFIAAAVANTSCKIPPLAISYRAFSVAKKTMDATGETLAAFQMVGFKKCETKFSPLTEKAKLLACYKAAREPLAVYVKHIKPLAKVLLASVWGVLESVFVAEDKSIDKTKKAVMIACEAANAAEVGLKTYGDKLGKFKVMILGGVLGLKVMVCK